MHNYLSFFMSNTSENPISSVFSAGFHSAIFTVVIQKGVNDFGFCTIYITN